MKVKDFIQEWVALTPDQEPTLVQIPDTLIPTIDITIGTAKIKKCYGWSYSKDCLYFKDNPICYKCFGIICVEESLTEMVKKYFTDLNVIAYTFVNDLHDFEDIIAQTINVFVKSATFVDDNFMLEPEILTFINNIRIRFDNKYLDYCKNLSVSEFNAAIIKHKSRLLNKPSKQKEFNGIWYI